MGIIKITGYCMHRNKLLIIGAGAAGFMIAKELNSNQALAEKYNLVGFIDDNPSIKHVINYNVLGSINMAREIIEDYDIGVVIIAIPSAKEDVISRIIDNIIDCNVSIKIVPGVFEIIEGDVKLNQIRDFEPSDLLGREEVTFSPEELSFYYENKTIFVTGAGGSIGSEIVIQLLSLPIKQLVLFGHGENSIHSILCKIDENDKKRIEYVIGDIKDYEKINHEIKRFKPDILFHGAAHKHVPLMEEYPDEAIKNNILGTHNIVKALIANNVKRLIFISTDKAVNPTSVMGATKRIGEMIVLAYSALHPEVNFSLTRFGNVLGSRGSVIPLFKSQIEKGGPVTITHKEVTRFFMSIREAARLVIKSGTIESGKIFILDMGKPIKILDLAKNMIKLYGYRYSDIPIIFTGLRKGEKLYEEILTQAEHLQKTEYEKLFVLNDYNIDLDKEALLAMINELESIASTYDKNKIKNIIKKYVPEFINKQE